MSGVHCNVRCLSPETSHKANNCPQSVINQLLTLSLFQCHDVTWKRTIKVLNLKFLNPFLFSFALVIVCQRISIRMHNIEGRFRCRTEFFSVCGRMCALFCLEILQAVAAMGLSHMQLCVCVSIFVLKIHPPLCTYWGKWLHSENNHIVFLWLLHSSVADSWAHRWTVGSLWKTVLQQAPSVHSLTWSGWSRHLLDTALCKLMGERGGGGYSP